MTARWLIPLAIYAAAALGADVSGTWTGTLVPEGENATDKLLLVLRQSGETVTGTIGPSESNRQAIQKGIVRENRVTFEIAVPDGRVFTFDLLVQGDELSGRMEVKIAEQVRRAAVAAKRSR